MKKLFAVLLCAMMLTACDNGNNTQVLQQGEQTPAPNSIKTMIASSDVKPIDEEWTILGEAYVTINGEDAEIFLATSATRGNDGYMMWDDSQQWRLIVLGENNSYSLFDGIMYGEAYIDVSMEGESLDIPSVKLINNSNNGLTITEYTYSDGAFYKENILIPDGNSNSIYNSFPTYYE